jgi:Protein of unknown function (DUF3048) C-terminal domain/Protein of unknown function (DUF3048) N-terminal domain
MFARFKHAMKPTSAQKLITGLAVVVLLSACAVQAKPAVLPTGKNPVISTTTLLAATSSAGPNPSPSPSVSATSLPPVIGPGYSPGYNPLTGLPANDPATLTQAPLMVSVTNFPITARPQSGLSLASIIWEVSIGQGMSRFLAVFYGDYLSQLDEILKNKPTGNPYGYVIAPIRSGRVVYEDIKVLFPDATLITRGASPEVAPRLTNWKKVFAVNPKDVNSAGLALDDLRGLPVQPVNPSDYASLMFTAQVPSGGEPAPRLDILYNHLDRVGWEYSPGQGAYLRSQDQMDDTGILVPAIDRLTGQQLAFENVLILFADHHFENVTGTIIRVDLLKGENKSGWLFRDGWQFPVLWSTQGGNLSIRDEKGQAIALKPGKTFIELVSLQSTWDNEQKLLRFHSPFLPTLTPSMTYTPTRTMTETTTPTFVPTGTPAPSATQIPSDTPAPVATQEPSATPSPSATQEPSATQSP